MSKVVLHRELSSREDLVSFIKVSGNDFDKPSWRLFIISFSKVTGLSEDKVSEVLNVPLVSLKRYVTSNDDYQTKPVPVLIGLMKRNILKFLEKNVR